MSFHIHEDRGAIQVGVLAVNLGERPGEVIGKNFIAHADRSPGPDGGSTRHVCLSSLIQGEGDRPRPPRELGRSWQNHKVHSRPGPQAGVNELEIGCFHLAGNDFNFPTRWVVGRSARTV